MRGVLGPLSLFLSSEGWVLGEGKFLGRGFFRICTNIRLLYESFLALEAS
jgi:hypothetical protein